MTEHSYTGWRPYIAEGYTQELGARFRRRAAGWHQLTAMNNDGEERQVWPAAMEVGARNS